MLRAVDLSHPALYGPKVVASMLVWLAFGLVAQRVPLWQRVVRRFPEVIHTDSGR